MDSSDRTVSVGGSISYDEIKSKFNTAGFSGLVLSGSDVLLSNLLEKDTIQKLSQNILGQLVTRKQLRKSPAVQDVLELRGKEYINMDTPVHVQNIPPEIKSHIREYLIEDHFICRIPTAELRGSKAVGKIDDGYILDTSLSSSYILQYSLGTKPLDLFYMQTPMYITGSTIEDVVPLVDHFQSYHHWVSKSLTRLQGINNFFTTTDKTYKLLIPSNPPPWITESLRFFGYTEDDWIQWNSRIASVENLLVPSIRAVERTACNTDLYDYKVLSPSACQWLRSRAIERISEKQRNKYSKKIYVSREDIGKRTVKNKKELNQLLDRYGFKSYSPGDLHFEEQVALFSQATDIIAPHGAGLTNLIFAENANVVEIFGTNIKKPTYYLLSNVMDHNYGFYVGTQSKGKDRDSNISVSVDELECLLSRMQM